MKFTLNNDLKTNRLMRTMISGLLLFILMFLVFDIIYKAGQYGSSYAAVHALLYGNEEEFIDPITMTGLLEGVHADTFFAMMTLLCVCTVFSRVSDAHLRKIVLVNVTMLSALLAVLSPLLAFYFSELFIWVWFASLLLWHLCAALMSVESLWKVQRL